MTKKIIVIMFIIFSAFLVTSLYRTFAYDNTVITNTSTDTDFDYTFTIGDNTLKEVTIDSNETIYLNVVLNNSNNASISYKVYYEMVSPEVKPDDLSVYLTASSNSSYGTALKNSSVNLSIKITNSTSSSATISFGSLVGFVNGGELSLSSGQMVLTNSPFATDSWDTIVSNLKINSNYYSVGDTKCIALDGFTTMNDNGCDNGEFLVRLSNTSTPSECSGEDYSETACGFVVEFVDIITTHVMNSTATNAESWPGSEMYTYLNDSTTGATSIYNALPSDVRTKIINTKSVTGHGFSESTNFISNSDKLYLLSPVEVYGANGEVTSYDSAYTSSRQLDYYQGAGVSTSNYAGVVKQYQGSNTNWWLRVPISNSSYDFLSGFSNGGFEAYSANDDTIGVAPAFRIG